MNIHLRWCFGKDISVLIAVAHSNNLVECLDAHRSGIHAKSTAEVSGNALHPLETRNPSISRERAELFELYPYAGCDLRAADITLLEFAAR